MKCPQCGAELSPALVICPHCGAELRPGFIRCRQCRSKVRANLSICPHCGAELVPLKRRWTKLLLSLVLGIGLALFLWSLWIRPRFSSPAALPVPSPSPSPALPTATSTPAPTPTPRPSPTSTPLSTPTLSPTPSPTPRPVVTILYPAKEGGIWRDIGWTKETRWLIPAYLHDLLGGKRDRRWSVRVMRRTGTREKGLPTGVAVGAESEERTFYWY